MFFIVTCVIYSSIIATHISHKSTKHPAQWNFTSPSKEKKYIYITCGYSILQTEKMFIFACGIRKIIAFYLYIIAS